MLREASVCKNCHWWQQGLDFGANMLGTMRREVMGPYNGICRRVFPSHAETQSDDWCAGFKGKDS